MDNVKQHATLGLYTIISAFSSAVSISLAIGSTWVEFGKLWVIIGSSVFSLPLLFTGAFQFPLWVWYLVVIIWIGQVSVVYKYS